MDTPNFTLTPQPRAHDGSRVRFDCGECGHTETFVRLKYADVAHVLGGDHYRGECPVMRHIGDESPELAAHRVQLAARHRNV
jgi:hypothetical protein